MQPDGTGPARLVAVWGLSGLPALLAGLGLLWPRLREGETDPLRYLRAGHLGRRFAVEFGVGNASTQLAVVGLGLFATPLAVGALRGATTLFGPMNVLFNSATAFGPPLLGRVGGARRKARAAAGVGVALAAVAAAGPWCSVLPDGAGRAAARRHLGPRPCTCCPPPAASTRPSRWAPARCWRCACCVPGPPCRSRSSSP